TILISYGGPSSTEVFTENTFAIRLKKGTLQSGAVVLSNLVQVQLSKGGCTTDPTVIARRFLGGPGTPGGLLKSYFDDPTVLIEIFSELGIAINLGQNPSLPLYQPIITDVANAVCSPVSSAGTLSLDVTIQFVIPQ